MRRNFDKLNFNEYYKNSILSQLNFINDSEIQMANLLNATDNRLSALKTIKDIANSAHRSVSYVFSLYQLMIMTHRPGYIRLPVQFDAMLISISSMEIKAQHEIALLEEKHVIPETIETHLMPNIHATTSLICSELNIRLKEMHSEEGAFLSDEEIRKIVGTHAELFAEQLYNSDQSVLVTRHNAMAAHYLEILKENNKQAEELSQTKSEAHDLKNTLAEVQQQIRNLKNDHAANLSQLENLASELSSAKFEQEKLQYEITRLRHQIDNPKHDSLVSLDTSSNSKSKQYFFSKFRQKKEDNNLSFETTNSMK